MKIYLYTAAAAIKIDPVAIIIIQLAVTPLLDTQPPAWVGGGEGGEGGGIT